MKNLTKEEREFLEKITQSYCSRHSSGYWTYRFRKKHYKRSRVLLQLHLNKKLEIGEHVHHKDGNKENDSIENLQMIDTKKFDYHCSLHHAGNRGRTNKTKIKSNKLKQEVIEKIFELYKQTKNYSEIARKLGISSFTVARYVEMNSFNKIS